MTTEHANAPVSRRGVDALAIRTDVGVDLLCDAADTERLTAALPERGAVAVSEPAAEMSARGVRAPAIRRGHGRIDDPAGGRR